MSAITIKSLYEKLYEECSVADFFSKSAHFVSMQGEYYGNSDKKFMLIGRATNGWEPLNMQSKELFGDEAEALFFDCSRWNWIESINGTLYSTHDREQTNLSKRYCIDKKPYWAYTKEIWSQIDGSFVNDDIWQKNIVWSNLYKVAPAAQDNPDWIARKTQYNTCLQILKEELEYYKPTHILIITGYDWFESFSCLFENVIDTGKRNVLRGENKNEDYVEATAEYKGAKVVVACRPEWREREKYVSQIVEAFK